jgi:DNA polymerase-1
MSIRRGQEVAIDIETTGLEWVDNLIGISMAWRTSDGMKSCYLEPYREGWLFQVEGVFIPDQILVVLFKNNITVWHSVPFDYRGIYKEFQKKFDIQPPEIAHDIAHMSKLVDYQESNSLSGLYSKYVGTPPEEWLAVKSKRGSLFKMNQEIVYRYAAFDAVATLLVYEKLRGLIPIPAELYEQDVRFTNLTLKMMYRGLPVNKRFIVSKELTFKRRMLDIVGELAPLGLNNPDSTRQVAKYLGQFVAPGEGERTKTGQLKTDVDNLLPYVNDPIVSKIVEFRQLSKAISSWFMDISIMAKFDGRLHALIYPFGTASYRISTSNINIQAIPMEERGTAFGLRAFGSFKGMFTSEREDEEICALDVKQAEFRLGAMLSKENNIAKAFSSGMDPYVQMAIDIWSNMSRRQDAKRAALASLYETGTMTFSKMNHVSLKEAEDVLFGFRKRYPKIKDASRFYEGFVVKNGYVTLMDGRRRYFGPFDETYKAFNQRVQGSVAVVMWPVMLKIEENFPGRIINQIHDSIELYLPRDEKKRAEIVEPVREWVEQAIPDRIRSMTTPRIPYPIDVKSWEREE